MAVLTMDIETFLDLAKRFNDLGWAVQDQLVDLDNGADPEEQNPNALKLIKEFLVYAERRGLEGTDIILEAIEAAKFDEEA